MGLSYLPVSGADHNSEQSPGEGTAVEAEPFPDVSFFRPEPTLPGAKGSLAVALLCQQRVQITLWIDGPGVYLSLNSEVAVLCHCSISHLASFSGLV